MSQGSMSQTRATLITYAAVSALLLLLAYPVLSWLVRTWLTDPYYSHGFLVPVLAALIAWRQWRWVRQEPRRGQTWPGLVITVPSLACTIWALRWHNYALASLALIALLAGILLLIEGWARLRHWLFPLLLLALMVPLPWIDQASPTFETFTARWATALARLVGIPAVQQGGEISLPGTTLIVGAPCSGLRSLVAMVTLGIVWVYLVKGRIAAKVVMLLAIVPLAALSNVVRVGLLLIVAALLSPDAAMAYYHRWSSPVLFVLSLGLLLLLGRALGCYRLREDIF
jgi:exosortase